MEHAARSLLAVALSIVGLATLAVVLSKQANTTGVLGAASSGFATTIGAAIAPVTGSY